MNPDEATSLKQLFLSMLPKDGGIVVGTVTKESPLTIQIENDEKLEISGSALLVPRNLTDYQVKVDIALADGKIDNSLKTFSIESGLLTVYNALKTGESVYLLRFNDGKSYYALERAIV